MEPFKTKLDMSALDVLLRDSPEHYKNAVKKYLNDSGFKHRINIINAIEKLKTVRDKHFVSSGVRVEKTTDNNPKNMDVVSGSVKSDRFTGWAEDYGAKPSGRGSRILGTNARNGDMSKKVQQKSRLISGMDIPKLSDFGDIRGNPGQQYAAMISMIARHPSITQASNGLFMLGGQFSPGVYRIKKGAVSKIQKSGKQAKGSAHWWYTYAPPVERIQKFDKDVKQKKVDWNTQALKVTQKEMEQTVLDYLRKYWANRLKRQ